jgi:hypothetical protein
MIRFRLAHHTTHAATIVEIWEGERFIAAIYPGDGDDPAASAIRVVSKHPINSGSVTTDRLGLSDAVIRIEASR